MALFGFFGWIILSFLVAYIGSQKRIGFGFSLIISLVFSPVVGIIVVSLSPYNYDDEYDNTILDAQLEQQKSLEKIASQNQTKPTIGIADELKKLKGLMDDGIITEAEFEAQKKKLLSD